MKALVSSSYGLPENLTLGDLPVSVPAAGHHESCRIDDERAVRENPGAEGQRTHARSLSAIGMSEPSIAAKVI